MRAALHAMAILRDTPARSVDAVAAAGELLSSRLVSVVLEESGLPAAWVDPRRLVVTDQNHTAAAPLAQETRDAVSASWCPAWRPAAFQ